MKVRSILVAAGLAAGLVVMGASGESTKAEKVGRVDTSSTVAGGAAAPAAQSYKVGDIVKLGNTQVIVHSFKDPYIPQSEFGKAAAGSRYVTVDTELKNLSTKPQSYSTIIQFEIQDASSQAFNVTIVPDQLPSLDGEAPPGGGRRGTLAFEVPNTSKGLKLAFKGDLFGRGSAYIILA